MAARSPGTSCLVIVGPTASGKSALAMRIAEAFGGEIIAADSRTVYKGMDIGTAKPSKADQRHIKHWCLDLVEPGQRFSAADFKAFASQAIQDIQNRGKQPILVGGTGLYVDALLHDFSFGGEVDPAKRQVLEAMSTEALQKAIEIADYPMPKNAKNRRHLVRTMERHGETGQRQDLEPGILVVGLLPSDDELRARIGQRAEAIFRSGVVAETQKLIKKYGQAKLQMTAGIVYKICLGLLAGEYDETRAIELFKTADWQYARRQKTWFKRNPHIKWFSDTESTYDFIRGELTHNQT